MNATRWLITMLFLTALLAPPRGVQADVTSVDVGDFLHTLPNEQGTFITTTAYTVMGYIKTTSSDPPGPECWAGGQLISSDNGTVFGLMRAGTNGENACAWNNAVGLGDQAAETPQVAMAPGWHHLASRLTGTTLEVFLDGVSGGTATVTGGSSALTADPLLVGWQFVGDRYTEMKVYNVALSTAEILRQARNHLRVYDRTLPTGHWTLEQCGEGATAHTMVFKDFSGSNRPLTGNSGGSGLTCVGSEFVSRPWGIQ